MAITTGLAIISWDFKAKNPDGTDNTFLPSITGGSVPADPSTQVIDWLAMGGRISLTIVCQISGTHPDMSTRSVKEATFRYNPATFLEYLGVYYPPGSFPLGGYSIQVPEVYSSSYPMVLIGQGANSNDNWNGEVTMNISDDQNFEIVHEFYLTADTEGYPAGKTYDNKFRLSKNSVYSDSEGDIERPSVYGNQKGINLNLAMRQFNYNVFAQDLSIPVKASFAGYDQDGSLSAITCLFTIERLAVPGAEETTFSPFEDNLVKLTFDDPSALIVEDESELTFIYRNLDRNVSTFFVDLRLKQVKVVTSGASAQLDGPIYSPVTWSQAAGVTEITFVVDGTKLDKTSIYQVHIRAALTDGPSGGKFLHFMSDEILSNGSPVDIPFTMEAEFWSRNGNHAEAFTINPQERCTSVLSINATEYDAMVIDPWTTFTNDIQSVQIQIFNEDSEQIFTSQVIKNQNGSWPDNDFIGLYIESGPSIDTVYHFYLNEFRAPYLNFQDLADWSGQDFTFRWTAIFRDPRSDEYSGEYYIDTVLTVGELDNENPSPYIENVHFLNPETLEEISDWHNLQTILVTATVDAIGANTYITVLVDRYPLGATMFNDFGLEEENPSGHSTPAWVIFEQKASNLVSDVPAQPTDGGISFLLDVSDLAGEEEYYVSIMAYEA